MDALGAMLEGRSIAVVGASQRPGSFGEMLMVQLVRGGFDGRVHPVNPNYSEVMGIPCLASLDELPEPVDVAILGVANAKLEVQLARAAAVGSRSAVIFASCHEPSTPDGPPLAERLADIASEAGMAVCGGNGMGFVNVERRLRACGFWEPLDLEPGGITFVTHSGSAFSAMLHARRGLRFNLVVSAGLELVTTVADYMAYALEQPSTRALALFLETVRDPAGFRAALGRAAERDIPVVALKVGRTGRSREMVAAHSGALAGDDAAFEALFDAYGVLRVGTLNEMADTLELLSSGRRAAPGGLAAIHDSGGERAHLIDVAEDAGVLFAAIGEKTRARLAGFLEPGLPAVNPLDAWGTGNDADEIFTGCMLALLDDPDTAALAFGVDLTPEVGENDYMKAALGVFEGTDKPMAVLANLTSAIASQDAATLRSNGLPVLEGTESGLRAFGHLMAYRDGRSRPAAASQAGLDGELAERWRVRLAMGDPLDEADSLTLVASYGIPVVPWELTRTLDETLAAADRLGWPVALKTAAPGVAHKSDAGGVWVGLDGPDALRRAHAHLVDRLGPLTIIQPSVSPGVELALGVVRDPQFGPLVMVGAGGMLIEVLADRRFGLPPIDETRAMAMIDRLAVREILRGTPDRPAADLGAVAAAIVALSRLAEDLGDELEALDVNPTIALPDRCLAVDALVIPRRG
jgi:acetate---CoA ligase (ADP-forming)